MTRLSRLGCDDGWLRDTTSTTAARTHLPLWWCPSWIVSCARRVGRWDVEVALCTRYLESLPRHGVTKVTDVTREGKRRGEEEQDQGITREDCVTRSLVEVLSRQGTVTTRTEVNEQTFIGLTRFVLSLYSRYVRTGGGTTLSGGAFARGVVPHRLRVRTHGGVVSRRLGVCTRGGWCHDLGDTHVVTTCPGLRVTTFVEVDTTRVCRSPFGVSRLLLRRFKSEIRK